jgi:hypothetical protein
MPDKSYLIWLNDSTYIVVEFSTIDGRVVSFVVRLMQISYEVEKCVARYDTAHGCPHLDLVDSHGRLLEKKWLLEMNLAEALRYAVQDFKLNHHSYVKNFKT